MNESIFVNKPTLEGLQALKIALVEFTEQTCYLRPEMWYGNFIENFWYARKEVIRLAKKGICKPMFICNGNTVPCIYNRLIFNVNKTIKL